MPSRRSEQLRNLVAEFNRVHAAWQIDENRPNPDEIYWDAVDAVKEGFMQGDIPADCRTLADAVAEFMVEEDEFENRQDENRLYPHKAFWEKRELLEAASKDAEYKPLAPLETIPELEKQKVPHSQIALIYGLRDRRGNLMPWLVQQELDKPGSILQSPGAIDGRDWHDPRVAQQQEAEQVAQQSAETGKRKQRASTKKPCHETPEELFSQGVSVRQAALMLCRPEEEVAEVFARLAKQRDDDIQERGGTQVDAALQASKGKKQAEQLANA